MLSGEQGGKCVTGRAGGRQLFEGRRVGGGGGGGAGW